MADQNVQKQNRQQISWKRNKEVSITETRGLYYLEKGEGGGRGGKGLT